MKEHCKHRQLAKWTKLGIGLAAFTVLGGLVVPEGLEGLEPIVVQAEEQASRSLTVYYRLKTGENDGDEERLQEVTYQLKPGETIDIRQAYPDYQFVSSESGQTVYHYDDLNATFAIYDSVTYQRKDYKPLSDTLPSLSYTVRYVVETETGLQDIAAPKTQELKGGSFEFVSGPEIDGYYRLISFSELIRYEDIQSGQKEVLIYYKPIEAAPLTYQVTLVHAVTGQILETSQKEILEGRSQDLATFIPEGYTSTKYGSGNLSYDEVKAGKTSVTILCVPFAEEAIGVPIEYRTQDGVLEEAYLTVSPGENLVVKAKEFAGYELVPGTASERTISYAHAKSFMSSMGILVDGLGFQYQKIGSPFKDNAPVHSMTDKEAKALYNQTVLLKDTLLKVVQLDESLYTEESRKEITYMLTLVDLYNDLLTGKVELKTQIGSIPPPEALFNIYRTDIKRIENGMAALVLKDKENAEQPTPPSTGSETDTPTQSGGGATTDTPSEPTAPALPSDIHGSASSNQVTDKSTTNSSSGQGTGGSGAVLTNKTSKATDVASDPILQTKKTVSETQPPSNQTKTSETQKALPATGEAHPSFSLVGLGLIGLSSLLISRRRTDRLSQ
ncbi:LPXTG cell wall anchor domain-containing protein [Streptococcus suis]|uniref:LPXTG cell wall anchor domain-containing protein n=1 Tax=Streptococcus suis TaxID=1307 RepID=A0A9X4MV92_STRSU|nr:LPXTG cell wall anchor domain-containing protein [Streptococcus suis]MCL4934144.1 LPXTG cell wall anchor domain-containing protein [Streptococcus suis]MDG4527664.1 LPXTG cell wall anchor domain-containing protein [Streptococcus suis]MDG4530019.1 LPXTG cell wall anchor domain-containing protein [Streptococcus suis]